MMAFPISKNTAPMFSVVHILYTFLAPQYSHDIDALVSNADV